MALYNDKDTPGRLGAFRSTKGAALGSSYRTRTCFVRRGQMSPIMFPGARGRKSQNNSRTENTVAHPPNDSEEKSRARARASASGRPGVGTTRGRLNHGNGALPPSLPPTPHPAAYPTAYPTSPFLLRGKSAERRR